MLSFSSTSMSKQHGESLTPGSIRARYAFRSSIRSRFYRHMIAQTSNDVPIVDSLKSYLSRMKRKGLKDTEKIIAATITSMQNGFTLDMALKPWVPQAEYGVLVSGVAANALAASLSRLLVTQERTRALISQIRGAFGLPLGNLAVAFAFMYFIGKSILPVIGDLVPKNQATGSVKGLYWLGDFATGFGLPITVVAVVAAITLLIWSLPRWTGAMRVRAEVVFPWNFYRDTQGFIWLMGYSALLSAGTKELAALSTQMTAASPYLIERLAAVRSLMQGGILLPQALRAASPELSRVGRVRYEFPSADMVDDIESLHGFADFPVRIDKVAEQWSSEMLTRTASVTKMLGFAANLLTYGLIIFIIYATNDLQSGLSATAGTLSH